MGVHLPYLLNLVQELNLPPDHPREVTRRYLVPQAPVVIMITILVIIITINILQVNIYI